MKIKNKTKAKTAARAAGFSIIELVVGIFIITSLTTLFLVNYHNSDKRSALIMARQKLASDLRLAQNYALSSKTYDGVSTPAGGWGAHFSLAEPGQYIIFADKNPPAGNQSYDDGEAAEVKTLPAGVSLSALSPASLVDIIFFPPQPTTYINGATDASALITLKEDVNNSTSTVSVNFFGLIDTQ